MRWKIYLPHIDAAQSGNYFMFRTRLFILLTSAIFLSAITAQTAQAASLRGKSFEVRGTATITVCFTNTIICIPAVLPVNFSIYVGSSGKLYSYSNNDKGKILDPRKVYREGKQQNRYRVQGSNLHMVSDDGESQTELIIAIRNGTCGVSARSNSPEATIKSTRSNMKCRIANGNGFAQ